MHKSNNQYITEEDTLIINMKKAGIEDVEIQLSLEIIKNDDPLRKAERNIYLQYIANILRKRPCALRTWYIHDILSKITGLAPGYISMICYSPDPASIIKSKS